MRVNISYRCLGIAIVAAVVLLSGCSTASRLGFSNAQWQGLTPTQRQQYTQGYHQVKEQKKEQPKTYAGPPLSIYFERGTAKMPPTFHSYRFQTVNFHIKAGDCRTIPLRSIDTRDHVGMRVCYNGLTLSLDPSRYQLSKANGSLHFNYSPIWKQGFTYSGVNTTGFAQLRHANVTIKAYNNPTTTGAGHGNDLGF